MTQPPQRPPREPPPPGAVAPAPPAAPVAYAPRTAAPAGLLVRALWFVFVGWWLTGIVSAVAWFAMITIIGLPLGIWLVNRIPTVITLRPRTSFVSAWTDADGRTRLNAVAIDQPPWPVRGIWFLIVGWWASALAMTLGYFLIALIVTLPLGLMVFNRVPFVASLYRY
jgi:uncharacterized membrane protein YccF (DUF307 family)